MLQQYWHHEKFRPGQEEIIQSVLDNRDTLALLPTGGGKSICFQVPALLNDGLCLVISPLIALMRDQVDALLQKGIPAMALHSGMTYYEVQTALQGATGGGLKFLYLSPERLESALFKQYLPALDITLIVVDEAHCISQWGYDFRPPYLRIADLRNELPGIPVIALTASATPVVQTDIADKLNFDNGNVFRNSFERPNISYSCFLTDSKINKLLEILRNVPGTGIIYCSSRKQTRELAQLLNLHKISADFYHAGLPQPERDEKQQNWISNQTRVMVCTNAFGMGIDKPDVRTVIHYDTPDCLENYYQEAGRAGRDGKKAYAVLLYQQEDLAALKEMPDKRFPPIPEIKRIYQALADHLQVPVGVGEGMYYDFDLVTFVQNFKLDSLLVINILKVLEQEGHISFSENIFLPSQVSFTSGKDNLNEFQLSHPAFEPLIKCLLRTYQGIIDNRVSVHEKQVAWLCHTNVEEIASQLKQLESFGIIEYLQQKNTPQIHYLLNRAPASYLEIKQDRYLERKKQYALRVETMIGYISLAENCRSRFMAEYFGDDTTRDCGICDNCLARKRKEISAEEFSRIETEIRTLMDTGVTVDELLLKLKRVPKENIWTVIDFLQAEQILLVDDRGNLKRS